LGLLVAAVSLVAGQVTLMSYCNMLASTCGSVHNIDNNTCMTAMANIMVGNPGDMNTNTLECRAAYFNATWLNSMSMSTLNNTEAMCRYGGPSGGGRCGDVLSNICNISTTVCNGVATAAYPNTSACITALGGINTNWGSKQGTSASSENSLECRVYHAMAGLTTSNLTYHCAHFALTGGPCGGPVSTEVQHYCETTNYFCTGTGYSQFTDLQQCLMLAPGYPMPAGSDATAASTGANTLGCRQYHVVNAAVNNGNNAHCGHAGPSGHTACGDITAAWNTLQTSVCTATTVASLISGVNNSAILNMIVPPGLTASDNYWTGTDQTMNTQACRVYHLTVAAESSTTMAAHCVHGSVSGGGQCGGYAANLCNFIQQVCGFASPPAAWQFASVSACTTAMGMYNVTNYGVESATTGDTLGCRFYHVGVAAQYLPTASMGALTGAATSLQTHCGHVLAPMSVGGGCNPGSTTPGGSSDAPLLSVSVAFFVALCATLF